MSTVSTWTVTGMTCGHCVASVSEEIGEIDGVEAVDVVLETGASPSPAPAPRPRRRRRRPWTRPATPWHEHARGRRCAWPASWPACWRCSRLTVGLGRLVGPAGRRDRQSPVTTMGDGGAAMAGGHPVGALQAAEGGYTLALAEPTLSPGRQRLGFTVTGPDGAPVTSYDVVHDKRLHLIVVRRRPHRLPARAPHARPEQRRVDDRRAARARRAGG